MTARSRSVGRSRVVIVTLALLTIVGAAACTGGTTSGTADDDRFGVGQCDPSDCTRIPMTVSAEKIDLLTELVKEFNATKASAGGKRVAIDPRSKASGEASSLLASGWPDNPNDPRPVIWTPASSAWGAILDQRLSTSGQPAMAGQGKPFMNTPLVIAMPKPMAQALGWPNTPLGWGDVLSLTQNPEGWAAFGHPEWGPFRLGKTNPNFSTSGLSALIAQNYAALKQTKDMTVEQLDTQEVRDYDTAVESSVVHYGDTTLTFLNNWYRSDQRGAPYTYASAVAVEEKSVIDYNRGNPDGRLDPGEEPRPPKVPLVAVYPKEGTVFSDNPLYVLDASWVSNDQREGARQFVEFVQGPERQTKVLQYNFRPGNPQVPIAQPIIAANGVDPNQPQTLLQVPSPPVMVKLLDTWEETRKPARVMLVIDVSGSMADFVDSNNTTKLELAQQAAVNSLEQFRDDDEVALRVFSTSLGPGKNLQFEDRVAFAPIGQNREEIRTEIRKLTPVAGTPLYNVAQASMQDLSDSYDDARINAVVLLTDGKNEDGTTKDDNQQLMELLNQLQSQGKGETGKPVRLFTIAYGKDASVDVLQQLADGANGAFYNATRDPTTIDKIFTQVISNF